MQRHNRNDTLQRNRWFLVILMDMEVEEKEVLFKVRMNTGVVWSKWNNGFNMTRE